MPYMKSGSPFLYDDTTGDIVGLKDHDGSEKTLITMSTAGLLLGGAAPTPAQAAAVRAGIGAPGRNKQIICALGDSRFSAGGSAGNNIFTNMCVRSNGAVAMGATFAGGGLTLATQVDTLLPSVLALTGYQKPGKCIVGAVTNDLAVSSGVGWNISTTKATLLTAIQLFESAGIEPVLMTETPRSDNATINSNVQSWNAFISAFALANGYLLLDFYSATVDPLTGLWISGYSTDGVHPITPGINAIGTAAAATLVQASNNKVRRESAVSSANLIPSGRGLFLADANANGLADGLSDFSTGITYSIVDDGLCKGKWQRAVRTVGSTGTSLARFDITVSAEAGELIELSGLVRSSGFETISQGFFLSAELRKSGALLTTLYAVNNMPVDVDTGVFRGVAVVPSGGIDLIRVNIQLIAPSSGAGGTLDVAEMTLTRYAADLIG